MLLQSSSPDVVSKKMSAAAPSAGPPSTEAGVAGVWNVLSGDTFEVCLGVTKGQPNLKKISLAGISAPRLGLKSLQVETLDEPGAWSSKEFLSELLLTKKVQFRRLYTSQSGDREYFEVRVTGGDKNHVGLKVLEAGWANVGLGAQVQLSVSTTWRSQRCAFSKSRNIGDCMS